MNWFQRFFRLSLKEKALLVEASLYLSYWQLIVKLFPYNWYSSFLGREVEMPKGESRFSVEEIKPIKKAIASGSKYLPWKPVCFPQALAAKSMLKRRGMQSTLYLGAAAHQLKIIDLHSWLNCGSYTVTGGTLKSKYKAVKVYQ